MNTRARTAATLLALHVAGGAIAPAAAQAKTAGNKAETASGGTPEAAIAADAVIVLVPFAFASDEKLANGCWARLYDDTGFKGNMLSLAGPVDIPRGRIGSGFEWGHKYDSLAVGPKATLVIYDSENYRQKTATFKPGQQLADLNAKLGPFENIRSLKITCSK